MFLGLSLGWFARPGGAAEPASPPETVPVESNPKAASGGLETVEVAARVNRTEVPLNREVELVVELRWSGALDQIEVEEIETPRCKNFEVVGSSSESETGEKVAIKRLGFTLKPQELGMGYVEPIQVTFRDKVSGEERVEETQRQSLKVVEAVQDQPRPWLPAILVIAVGVGVLTLVLLVWRRRRSRGELEEEEELVETPGERGLRLLAEASDLRIAGRIREYYDLISRVVRDYLQATYGVAAREQPTADLVAALEAKEVELADRARATPGGAEMNGVWERAKSLLESEPKRTETAEEAVG